MMEYQILRGSLGLLQVGIVWILRKKNIEHMPKLCALMSLSAVLNLCPAFPNSPLWKHYVQTPAFLFILCLTGAATVEFFGFLKSRTFIEERVALARWAATVGGISVWLFWSGWHPENWYQGIMLARQYVMVWLMGSFAAGWCWLVALRPIHMQLQTADHGQWWGGWLLLSSALAGTTKWGIVWRFIEWEGWEISWRTVSDCLIGAQIFVAAAIAVNLWYWREDAPSVCAQDDLDDLQSLERFPTYHPQTF
jgi:hypothetical protein